MSANEAIDPHRVLHWMNARKLTPSMVAHASDIDTALIEGLISSRSATLDGAQVQRLAATLNVTEAQLSAAAEAPEVIYRSREELEATCRGLMRDGIHFYDYYSLPSPVGEIAPVVIEIRCPSDRIPALNNGHLEPAITVNLGPGHINGRFAAELNPDTWHHLRANHGAHGDWIVGDSYVEPPYCPHTYSLVEDNRPARILSYTVKSNLEGLVTRTNRWSDSTYSSFMENLGEGQHIPSAFLQTHMRRRCYESSTLAAATGIGLNSLKAFIDGDAGSLDSEQVRALASALAVDYRMLLPVQSDHDRIGKTVRTVAESVQSIRPYMSYSVANAAMSVNYPDLIGLFMKLDKADEDSALDLGDHSATHYLVTGGAPILWWRDNGVLRSQKMKPWDSLWIGPHVKHSFSGSGALIKMGNGEGVCYLDQVEMSNTFQVADTLRRARRDTTGWGYDAGA